MVKVTEANNSTYKSTNVTIGKTIFSVMQVTGKLNYISIRKETNNPFKTLGKDFKNFNEAVRHYKNPTMKVELLKIELGFSL
jgi:hypothetical protein